MVGEFTAEELFEGCVEYLNLSSEQREVSNLFRFWDHLFFKTSRSKDSIFLAWATVRKLVETDVNHQQLTEIAAGPFEEILVTIGEPMYNLFLDSDYLIVRKLLPFVWFGRINPEVEKWVKSI
jgi:hypothetical protein